MLDGESVEFWLVRNGWAWQFVKYDQSEELRLAQKLAKHDGLGLWAGEANGLKPMPPWEYRDRKRTLSKIKSERETSTTPAGTGSFWLNTGSGSRHNEGCKYYKNTKRGKPCGAERGTSVWDLWGLGFLCEFVDSHMTRVSSIAVVVGRTDRHGATIS